MGALLRLRALLLVVLCATFLPVSSNNVLTMLQLASKKDPWLTQLFQNSYPIGGDGANKDPSKPSMSKECFDSMWTYTKGLESEEWAFIMFDATAVPQSGITAGHFHWLGDHEYCQTAKATGKRLTLTGLGTVTHDFDAKYCRTYYAYFLEGPAASIGVCVPDSCTPEDVKNLLAEEVPAFYTYCGEREKFKDDAGAIVATVILCLFGFILLSSTILDYVLEWREAKSNKEETPAIDLNSMEQNGQGQGSQGSVTGVALSDLAPGKPPETKTSATRQYGKPLQVILAFSLRRNAPRVLSTRLPPGTYTAFNGIRVLSMAWILLGHTWQLGAYVLPYSGPLPVYGVENIYSQYKLQTRFTHQVINSMSLAVETFFVLGSCLVTISFLKVIARQDGRPTVLQMVMHYVHRYLRLTPVYAVILMIFTTMFYHWVSGPMAPEKLSDVEGCKERWWANLLYIQNFYQPDKGMCMGWTWYLAIDFQYFVIAPLFIFILYKFPIPGAVFLFLGYCGSLTARAVIWSSDDPNWFLDVYIRPWCRFGPYAIGIALGYVLHRTKSKVKIPMVGVIVGWLLAILACGLSVYGPYDKGDCEGCEKWPGEAETAYNVTFRDLFALGVAWIMFACSTGYGGIINTWLSWPGFVPVSKLTYISYLVHPIIIYGNYFSRQRALYVEDLTMITMFCAHLVLTLAASLILTLMFEVPVLELEKILLPSRKKKE